MSIVNFRKNLNTLETEVFDLLRNQDTLSLRDAKVIEDAINNGDIDTCDIFDDFVDWVSENDSIDWETLADFKDHYQNLRSYEENLIILKVDSSAIYDFIDNLF